MLKAVVSDASYFIILTNIKELDLLQRTIGVMIIAKKRGIINSIKPYLEKIHSTNFRSSEELERQARKEAEE